MLFKNLCLRQILGVRVPGGDLCAKRRSTDRGGNKEVFQKALPCGYRPHNAGRYADAFNTIPGDAAKGMARRKGIDHGKMLYYGDGYATAWFMWRDEEATKAFAGGA